jgi:hypothetical protein
MGWLQRILDPPDKGASPQPDRRPAAARPAVNAPVSTLLRLAKWSVVVLGFLLGAFFIRLNQNHDGILILGGWFLRATRPRLEGFTLAPV